MIEKMKVIRRFYAEHRTECRKRWDKWQEQQKDIRKHREEDFWYSGMYGCNLCQIIRRQ